MPESDDGRELIERWRGGDEDAARTLFDRYVDRLVALARQRLSQRLASRVDPEDVVQSVFRTFFARLREGRFLIAEQDDLCKLLVRITVHKVLRQVEFHCAARRNPGLEVPQSERMRERMVEVLDREPTPEAAAALLDELEHFLDQLRPQEREVLELRLQGHSNEEIAAKLGTYDRKVRRVFERVRGLAEREGLTPWTRPSDN